MALVLKDRVKETTTTTGTGTLTLAGAVTGYQSFSSAIGNTNTTYYAIYLDGGSEWEVGLGTVSAGALSRDTIFASSNAGSAVNFSAGTKSVWGDYPAGKAVYADQDGKLKVDGNYYVPFSSVSAPSFEEGLLWYDSSQKLLSFYSDISTAPIHIGQDIQTRVINNTGSTIPNGSPVYITSTPSGGQYPNIALAKADVAATAAVLGLANGAIANGSYGYVTSLGVIDNVNTSSYTVGQVLYLSPYSAGQLMNTVPPTGLVVMVGKVSYVDSSAGRIYVKQTTPLNVSASSIVGTVAVANGGTGQASALVAGSVVYGSSTTAMGVTAAGTSGQVLTSQGSGTPIWTTPTTGTVTSVAATAGTGISVTGSPITSSGTLTITNTAPDQTVSLTAGTGISVTGTYPSFTIANTSSSGGITIGLAKAIAINCILP
jgi:hypothetical protein